MFSKLKKDNQGFTIIEVLIVLAIAGLIMIIVFLAVPALQRNQRNQSFRTQANNIATAYQEVSANKGGAILAASDSGAVKDAANSRDLTSITIAPHVAGNVSITGYTTAIIRTNATCAAADSAVATGGKTSRQIAVYFNIEKGDGNEQIQCISS